jgi:hypothetical protein
MLGARGHQAGAAPEHNTPAVEPKVIDIDQQGQLAQ